LREKPRKVVRLLVRKRPKWKVTTKWTNKEDQKNQSGGLKANLEQGNIVGQLHCEGAVS